MRVCNFNAGPAAMPAAVLEVMQHDLLDYKGRGLSVLEMSHRSADFVDIAHQAEADLRDLLQVPSNYSVLFMQGGASAQFALTVQNLDVNRRVDFANTGYWSVKAMRVAEQLSDTHEAITTVMSPSMTLPADTPWAIDPAASYLHITDNETIEGFLLNVLPDTDLPIVADMSSSILSRRIDVSRYAMIYAGAQKNIGPAGITVVIIRDDLLERSRNQKTLPAFFNYAAMADADSMLNTPPTFAWYAAGLVFRWLLSEGGLDSIYKRNVRQAEHVYRIIDQYSCYYNAIAPAHRSIMNIPFQLTGRDETAFLTGAQQRGLIGLKGHKSVGGLRVSLYNAVPDESVDKLVAYLSEFAESSH